MFQKTMSTCPDGRFQPENFFLKTFENFEYFSDFELTFLLVFSKLISMGLEEQFGVIFLKKNFVVYKSSDFERKVFGSVVKTAFYVSEGSFWANNFCEFRSWRSQNRQIIGEKRLHTEGMTSFS